jgi:hypothetical protein
LLTEWRPHRLERYSEGVAALRTVLDTRSRVLGADHSDTLATRQTLAQVLAVRARHQRDRTLEAVLGLVGGLLIFAAWYFFFR